MLKNFAEFVELLQEKDRNQLQLSALAVRLFMPDNYLLENINEANYLNGIGLNEEYFDKWTSFLSQIVDMPCDGRIEIEGKIDFERSEKQFKVLPNFDSKGKMILYGVIGGTKEIVVPYGAQTFFELMKGRSTDVLLRCPNCKKIFINTTHRHMIYCKKGCRTHYAVKKLRGQVG